MKKKVLMPLSDMVALPTTGDDLREWRRLLSWSQSRAARELGVSLRFISRLENRTDAKPVKRPLGLACVALWTINERTKQ